MSETVIRKLYTAINKDLKTLHLEIKDEQRALLANVRAEFASMHTKVDHQTARIDKLMTVVEGMTKPIADLQHEYMPIIDHLRDLERRVSRIESKGK